MDSSSSTIYKPATSQFHQAVEAFKKRFLTETLVRHGGNRTQTARELGIQRTWLMRLIRELGISVPVPQRFRR